MNKCDIEEFLRQSSITDVRTGRELPVGDFQHAWQEFIFSRQENLETKLVMQGLSSEYRKQDFTLGVLLDKLTDQMLADDIREAAETLQLTISYLNYTKGFYEGLKFAMMAGQL